MMDLKVKGSIFIVILGSVFFVNFSFAKPSNFNLKLNEMREIFWIARAIQWIHPKLDESKYLEFAHGIHKASRRYGIDPLLLISIAHQESSFREYLPEGRAGEIGLCQIRKIWIKNSDFIGEFGRIKVSDLNRSSKSFLYAAWILKDLKEKERGSLPFWSFYNARLFKNRIKYFVAVNKKISSLKKYEAYYKNKSEILLAKSEEVPEDSVLLRETDEKVANRKEASIEEDSTPQTGRWAARRPVRKHVAYSSSRRGSEKIENPHPPTVISAALTLGISPKWFIEKLIK